MLCIVTGCVFFPPKLKMSESAEDMESSRYSQVVFVDIPRSYPLHADVICCYRLTGDLIPSAKDWIGIYKVESCSLGVSSCFLERFVYVLYKSSNTNFQGGVQKVQENYT